MPGGSSAHGFVFSSPESFSLSISLAITVPTSHIALYTSHSTLYTLHFTLHTLHLTPRTLHFTHTLHFRLNTLHFTIHTSHWTLHTHTLHSTLYTLHFTFHTPHSTLHFTFQIWHLALHNLHSTLYTYTLRIILYTWQPSICTINKCVPVSIRVRGLHLVCWLNSSLWGNTLLEISTTQAGSLCASLACCWLAWCWELWWPRPATSHLPMPCAWVKATGHYTRVNYNDFTPTSLEWCVGLGVTIPFFSDYWSEIV